VHTKPGTDVRSRGVEGRDLLLLSHGAVCPFDRGVSTFPDEARNLGWIRANILDEISFERWVDIFSVWEE
jgi:hypothetical protein